jgi:hypothetical protein
MRRGIEGRRYVQYLAFPEACDHCGETKEAVELVDSWTKRILDRGCIECIEDAWAKVYAL